MSTLQLVHFWVASGCFGVACAGLVLMLLGFLAPVRSKAGARAFTVGIVTAVSAVVVYLLYAIAAVITVVVMRS